MGIWWTKWQWNRVFLRVVVVSLVIIIPPVFRAHLGLHAALTRRRNGRSLVTVKGKGKAVPLQARRGPEGSRKLRFPDFVTAAQDGGKVVSLTHRPPLPPGSTAGTHFC